MADGLSSFSRYSRDPRRVAREALGFGRAGGEGAGSRGELPLNEAFETVAAVLVGLGIQVEADDGQRGRLEIEQPLKLRFEVIGRGLRVIAWPRRSIPQAAGLWANLY